MATWSNWEGSVRCEPREIARPTREAEVVEALARARARGWRVRVCGSGHSFTPLVATDGMLLDLSGLDGIARLEPEEERAWVRAGTTLHALGEPLLAAGLALRNLGDIDVQAVGGAVATGTHGTGRTLPSLSAQVSGLRILRADGSLEVVRQEDRPEELDAARVALGALGVVTAVRFALAPAHRLHERVERLATDELLADLDERIARHRHFEFFWYPTRDRVEAKHLDPTDAPEDELPERRGERIGWSARVLPSVREDRFVEMEYSVPAEAGRACFDEVRARMRARHPEVAWPVEYRTLRADEGWLSTAHHRETVTLSLHQGSGLPHRAFFEDLEPVFLAHGGRPHWGKLHGLGADALAERYPRFTDFLELRERWDPSDTFVNEHLASLFGR